MGSTSDWDTMCHTAEILEKFNVPFEKEVVSAHRTPVWMAEFAQGAEARGIEVIIAGAGGAAHLPGMVASHTVLPVLGVPVQSAALQGLDSLLSIVQMPGGVPGRHARDRQTRRHQRWPAGRRHPRDDAARSARAAAPVPRRANRQGPTGLASVNRIVLPGATIGVLGSGQLGRMLALEARRMGYRVHTLSPGVDTPTGQVADLEVSADYDDLEAIRAFARGVDVVTFEFENVPTDAANSAAEIVPVRPGGAALHVTQQRAREKAFLADRGYPVTPFAKAQSLDELAHWPRFGGSSRDRQDRRLRLRRQGPAPHRPHRRRRARVGTDRPPGSDHREAGQFHARDFGGSGARPRRRSSRITAPSRTCITTTSSI